MARSGFPAVKSTPADRFLLILPVWGQKVKGIGPSPLVVLIGSREQETARSADRTAITTSLGLSHESIDTELMIMTHDLVVIASSGGQMT